MGNFELGFGFFFLILGAISLYAYLSENEKMFQKKRYFISLWGERLGKILHFTSYVVLPILVGLALIIVNL